MTRNKNLVILSNEKIFKNINGFHCDNIDMKSIPEGLNIYGKVLFFARKSNINLAFDIRFTKRPACAGGCDRVCTTLTLCLQTIMKAVRYIRDCRNGLVWPAIDCFKITAVNMVFCIYLSHIIATIKSRLYLCGKRKRAVSLD